MYAFNTTTGHSVCVVVANCTVTPRPDPNTPADASNCRRFSNVSLRLPFVAPTMLATKRSRTGSLTLESEDAVPARTAVGGGGGGAFALSLASPGCGRGAMDVSAGTGGSASEAGTPAAAAAAADSSASSRREMTALTTFEFKHGIVKTPVLAGSLAEVESVLRKALRLRPDAFNIQFVNFDSQLLPLSQVSLAALGASTHASAGWSSAFSPSRASCF